MSSANDSSVHTGWLLDQVASAGRENLDPVHVSRYDGLEDAGAADEVAVVERLGLRADSVALRAKVDQAGLDNVEVVEAGFLTYEHQGRPADVIYSRYALHHLPDFWNGVALARMHAALRPRGVLRIWDVVYHFDPADAETRLEAWCATGGPADGQGWSRGDYEENVRDEHSTYTRVLEAMAQRAGFVIEQAEYSDDGIFAKYVFRRA